MGNAINVEGLSKIYGEISVVKEISFSVEDGEIFGFLGPNGAGKTTTIRMMIGQLSFNSGSIQILNKKIPDDISEIKSLVGVVPDYQNIYDRISVRQNLEFFAALNNVGSERIDEVLKEVFLVEHQYKASKDLSRGLRQRSLIARALLHRPKVFFLDEPTSALDPHSAKLIRDLVLKLKNSGTTVFLTTHYMEEADNLCDRLAIMNQGQIVACGTPESLKNKYGRNTALVDYLENGNSLTVELALNEDSDRNKLCSLIQSGMIKKIHTQEATLEEVFMRVTGDKWQSDQGEA